MHVLKVGIRPIEPFSSVEVPWNRFFLFRTGFTCFFLHCLFNLSNWKILFDPCFIFEFFFYLCENTAGISFSKSLLQRTLQKKSGCQPWPWPRRSLCLRPCSWNHQMASFYRDFPISEAPNGSHRHQSCHWKPRWTTDHPKGHACRTQRFGILRNKVMKRGNDFNGIFAGSNVKGGIGSFLITKN